MKRIFSTHIKNLRVLPSTGLCFQEPSRLTHHRSTTTIHNSFSTFQQSFENSTLSTAPKTDFTHGITHDTVKQPSTSPSNNNEPLDTTLRSVTEDAEEIDTQESSEELTDIMKEIGFYNRMMDEIRHSQGLDPIPQRTIIQNQVKREYFAYKNYYEMKDLNIKFKLVLARLQDLSLTRSHTPLQSIKQLSPDDTDPQIITPNTLVKKYTSESIKPFPPVWDSPKVLEDYLTLLTSQKYIVSMKERPQLVRTLILDLLRINSPDTMYCRSSKAYNIAIKYFIKTEDLKTVRFLYDQMKTESGGIYPDTKTFNLMLSPTASRLVGGKYGYRRRYYNYYLRKMYSIYSQEIEKEKLTSNKSAPFIGSELDNSSKSPQNPLDSHALPNYQNFHSSPIDLYDPVHEAILRNTPHKKETVYFRSPVEFAISILRDMTELRVAADAETWNIFLISAIGPVAKSAVLKCMADLEIPLSLMGQTAVLVDIADFLGPQKALEIIQAEDGSYPITPSAIGVVISRLLDIPTSTNILLAWNILRKYSARKRVLYPHGERKKVTDHLTSDPKNPKFVPTVSILNMFVKSFAEQGRLDWIAGVMATFIYDWNVVPNIITWTHILKTIVISPPHSLKIPLLELVYYTMLKISKTDSVDSLPRDARNLIRRAQSQVEFHSKKFESLKNSHKITEDIQQRLNQLLSNSLRDPFRPLTKQDIWGVREFWVHALKQLKWGDTPYLTFREPSSEEELLSEVDIIREICSRQMPCGEIQGEKPSSSMKANSEVSFIDSSIEASKSATAFLSQFESIEVNDHNRNDQDNALTTSPDSSPHLFTISCVLGVDDPSQPPIYQPTSSFKSAIPQDTFTWLLDEWKPFYDQAKQKYRKKIDEIERNRRLEMQKNPHQAYINDLRKEFGLIKDGDE